MLKQQQEMAKLGEAGKKAADKTGKAFKDNGSSIESLVMKVGGYAAAFGGVTQAMELVNTAYVEQQRKLQETIRLAED